MNSASESDVDSMVDLRRYEALLGMADLMVHYGTLADLLRELAVRLHSVTTFEVATFSLYDSSRGVMHVHTWEGARVFPCPLK